VITIPVNCLAIVGRKAAPSRGVKMLGVSPKAPPGPLHQGQSRAGSLAKSEMQLNSSPASMKKNPPPIRALPCVVLAKVGS